MKIDRFLINFMIKFVENRPSVGRLDSTSTWDMSSPYRKKKWGLPHLRPHFSELEAYCDKF